MLGIGFITATGCGKPVLREADPSLGDYYTKKEYDHLTKEQREQYCEDLADQLESYRDQIASGHEALAALQKNAPALCAEVDSLRSVQAALSRTVAAEESLAVARRGATRPIDTGTTTSYQVKPGDSLWKISRGAYGRGSEWERIFRLNGDRVRDPNLIFPGQTLAIPR
jgi:nucleoid-associated protein YgaU